MTQYTLYDHLESKHCCLCLEPPLGGSLLHLQTEGSVWTPKAKTIKLPGACKVGMERRWNGVSAHFSRPNHLYTEPPLQPPSQDYNHGRR